MHQQEGGNKGKWSLKKGEGEKQSNESKKRETEGEKVDLLM